MMVLYASKVRPDFSGMVFALELTNDEGVALSANNWMEPCDGRFVLDCEIDGKQRRLTIEWVRPVASGGWLMLPGRSEDV